MDIKHLNIYKENCLFLACGKNSNPEIIKYLIDEYKININDKYQNNYNILFYAAIANKNIEILKTLVNDYKMDIYQKNYSQNCFILALLL